ECDPAPRPRCPRRKGQDNAGCLSSKRQCHRHRQQSKIKSRADDEFDERRCRTSTGGTPADGPGDTSPRWPGGALAAQPLRSLAGGQGGAGDSYRVAVTRGTKGRRVAWAGKQDGADRRSGTSAGEAQADGGAPAGGVSWSRRAARYVDYARLSPARRIASRIGSATSRRSSGRRIGPRRWDKQSGVARRIAGRRISRAENKI